MQILDHAIFIADAHFSPNDPRAFDLLDKLIANPPPQVFFMGDIFHLLIGSIATSLKNHHSILEKIHYLSQKTQVFYFEGNHDFGLSHKTLPNVHIIKRKNQPMQFRYNHQIFLLAHGDLFLSNSYHIYIKLMTNPISLFAFKAIDFLTQGLLYNKIQTKIMQKPIFALKSTKDFINKRNIAYEKYAKKHSLIYQKAIEGHFHSDLQDKRYIALPSLYCQKKILRIINNDFLAFIA